MLNGTTPCEVVPTVAIRGEDEGTFVLVPQAAPGEAPLPEAPQRLTLRIFVDGMDTVFVRGEKLWIKQEQPKLPGANGGRGPTWVNARSPTLPTSNHRSETSGIDSASLV